MKSSGEIRGRQLCKEAVLTLRQEHLAHRALFRLNKIYSRGAQDSTEKQSVRAHTHSHVCTHSHTHTQPLRYFFRSTLFCYWPTVGIFNRLEKDYSINPLQDCFYSHLCDISQRESVLPRPINHSRWVMRAINLSLNPRHIKSSWIEGQSRENIAKIWHALHEDDSYLHSFQSRLKTGYAQKKQSCCIYLIRWSANFIWKRCMCLIQTPVSQQKDSLISVFLGQKHDIRIVGEYKQKSTHCLSARTCVWLEYKLDEQINCGTLVTH